MFVSIRGVCSSSSTQAAIAQLGERQTEDLKVPGSIPGLGILSHVHLCLVSCFALSCRVVSVLWCVCFCVVVLRRVSLRRVYVVSRILLVVCKLRVSCDLFVLCNCLCLVNCTYHVFFWGVELAEIVGCAGGVWGVVVCRVVTCVWVCMCARVHLGAPRPVARAQPWALEEGLYSEPDTQPRTLFLFCFFLGVLRETSCIL